MNFVWIYCKSGARSDELRWSMRSVVEHYQGEAKITLIGDKPAWYTGHYINQKQKVSGAFGGYRDSLRKIQTAALSDEIDEEFVWMMDDVYFIGKVTEEELRLPLHDHTYDLDKLKEWRPSALNYEWQRLKRDTLLKLYEQGYIRNDVIYDYACHTPHVIKSPELLKIIEDYDLFDGKEFYLWENLYGNIHYKESTHYKPLFRRYLAAPIYQNVVDDVGRGACIMNHVDEAWNEDIRAFLFDTFPNQPDHEEGRCPPPNRDKCGDQSQHSTDKVAVAGFIKYLEGKKVAIVGNGEFKEKLGETIDSFDVVIRFNNYEIKGYEEYVGTKTNVWAHCMNMNVKVRATVFDYNICPEPKHLIDPKKIRPLNQKQCVFGPNDLYDKIPIDRPSTGIAVINWLWRSGIRFECFGFDGFESKHYFDEQQNKYHRTNDEKKAYESFQNRRKVVAIIPYKFSESRANALSFVKKWAESTFDEVIISEHEGDGPFCKSRLINNGLRQAPDDCVVSISDADVVIDPENIRISIMKARLFDGMSFPYLKINKLCSSDTAYVIKSGKYKAFSNGGPVLRSPGGMFLIAKSSLVKIGGFDERFTEWGGEDNAAKWMAEKTVAMPNRGGGTLIHLWHEPNRSKPRMNQNLWNQYRRMSVREMRDLADVLRDSLLNGGGVVDVPKPVKGKSAPEIRGRELTVRVSHLDSPAVCEVGVLRGVMSNIILSTIPAMHLRMVDSWLPSSRQPQHYKATGDTCSMLTASQVAHNEKLSRAIADRYDGAEVVKNNSVDAARLFADNGDVFDLVFLDSDHSFSGLFDDIWAYLPLVKVGGWIGGHDYMNKSDSRFDFSGVDKAVSYLAKFTGGEIKKGGNFTWWMKVTDEIKQRYSLCFGLEDHSPLIM